MIKLVIFDYDDTLVRSSNLFFQADCQTAKSLGLQPPTKDEYFQLWGKAHTEMIKALYPNFPIEKYLSKYREIYNPEDLKLFDDAMALLENLSGKIKLAILSAKHKEYVEEHLKLLGIERFFSYIHCSESSVFQKPDSRVFDDILTYHKINPCEALYIGDMTMDYECADKAGLEFIAVTTGIDEKTKFESLGCQNIYPNLKETQPIIDLMISPKTDSKSVNERSVKTIVFTGGPCAGKTTIIFNYLNKKYGKKIYFVQEAAATLLATKFKDRPKELTEEWHNKLRDEIMALQPENERNAIHNAESAGAKIVIYDRALLDEAAYTKGGLKELLKIYNLELNSVLSRYDTVIHIQTLALLDKEMYNQRVSKLTLENAEEAIEKDKQIERAWSVHPNFILIKQSKNEESIQKRIEEIINNMLDTTI